MSRFQVISPVLVLLPALAGCPILCTPSLNPGVTISVTDAGTGAIVPRPTLILTDGDYQETIQTDLDDASVAGSTYISYGGAIERPGIYSLRVEAPGYETQTIPYIRVLRGYCHVQAVHVDVALQPAQQPDRAGLNDISRELPRANQQSQIPHSASVMRMTR